MIEEKDIDEIFEKETDIPFMRLWLEKVPKTLVEKYKGDKEKLERLSYVQEVINNRIKQLTS